MTAWTFEELLDEVWPLDVYVREAGQLEQILVRVPQHIASTFKRECAARGITQRAAVEALLREWLVPEAAA